MDKNLNKTFIYSFSTFIFEEDCRMKDDLSTDVPCRSVRENYVINAREMGVVQPLAELRNVLCGHNPI